MAAGDSQVYGQFVHNQSTGASVVNFASDTLKVALFVAAYTPNIDNDDYYDDIITHELAAGDGYAAGGATLANQAVAYDTANNWSKLTCDNPSWTFTVAKQFAWAALYKDTGVAATSPLVSYWDLGNASRSGPFALTINSDGLLQLRATAQTG